MRLILLLLEPRRNLIMSFNCINYLLNTVHVKYLRLIIIQIDNNEFLRKILQIKRQKIELIMNE